VCRCGWFHTYFPDNPEWKPDDPLAAALAGPGRLKEPTPPWLRVFQLTSSFPWWLRWRHIPDTCQSCSQRVSFVVATHVRPGVQALSCLCLACGQATVEYLYYGREVRETPVSGSEWSPACVAVARLRRAVFGAPPFWNPGTPYVSEGDDADDSDADLL
jgi:hypothetical protein